MIHNVHCSLFWICSTQRLVIFFHFSVNSLHCLIHNPYQIVFQKFIEISSNRRSRDHLGFDQEHDSNSRHCRTLLPSFSRPISFTGEFLSMPPSHTHIPEPNTHPCSISFLNTCNNSWGTCYVSLVLTGNITD